MCVIFRFAFGASGSLSEYHISSKRDLFIRIIRPREPPHLDRPRMYFSSENGKVIDAIRIQIEKWKIEDLITDSEYYILLACLIETVSFYANVAGVYAAFQKMGSASSKTIDLASH